MADFPVGGISEAVSKVLSSIIPPRTYTYLTAFIPGLFFQISLAFANPSYVSQLVARLHEALPLRPYMLLAIGLFLTFLIGNSFMLFVSILIQRLLAMVYKLWAFVWIQFCKWPILPVSSWLLKSPRWNKRRWVPDLARYAQAKALGFPDESRGARKCWAIFARQVLLNQYGIKVDALEQEEWNALYSAFAPIKIQASILIIAAAATGWAGLMAACFAPALRNRYYLGFAIFMILFGLLHDWYVIESFQDPLSFGILKLRFLLRENRRRPSPPSRRPENKPPDAGELAR